MAKINIITEPKPRGEHMWILRRCAEEIKKHNSNVKIFDYTKRLSLEGDINYFINYGTYYPTQSGINIGHFTHLEKAGIQRHTFLKLIKEFDYFTCTCDITADILIVNGADPNRIFKIPYGADPQLKKDIIFGVVGRTYSSGRKGEALIKKMLHNGFNVIGWGKGWPCHIQSSDYSKLPEFYATIDYLLVTSNNEGGPVPVIDALSAGVPVIAPNVGWCWEFPVLRYEVGEWESLFKLLKTLTILPTWESWSGKHNELFKLCLNATDKKRNSNRANSESFG